MIRNTLFITLAIISLVACSNQSAEEMSPSKEALIDAVEADAKEAPAIAIKEMKQEVKEAAEEITDETTVAIDVEIPATE